MKEDNNYIDAEYKEIPKANTEISLTAPQIAKKINDSDIRVRYWADEYGDLIGIEKINSRKTYKESQVKRFAFIKELIDNKNFKSEQVRTYISKHGFKYEKFDSGLVNPKDPLGFEALAASLSVENKAMLKAELNEFYVKVAKNNQDTLDNIVQLVNNFMNIQKDMNLENKAEIESSVDMILDNKSEQIKKDIQQEMSTITAALEEQSTQLQQKFQSIIDENEKKVTERDIKMTNNLNKILEERKNQYEEDKKHKHFSIFSRFFNNKKE